MDLPFLGILYKLNRIYGLLWLASFTWHNVFKVLSWRTSLLAQTVKSLPALWETQVWSLGHENPLEKEMAIHSSILAWKIPWTEKPVHGVAKSWTQPSDFTWCFNNKDLDFFLPSFLFLDWITFHYMAVSLLIYPFHQLSYIWVSAFDSRMMLLWIFIYMFLCRHKLSSDASRLIFLVTIKQIKPNENITLKQQ